MKISANFQYTGQDGKPVFADIPYCEYIKLPAPGDAAIPHEAAGLVIYKGMDIVKACTCLKMTLFKIAGKARHYPGGFILCSLFCSIRR